MGRCRVYLRQVLELAISKDTPVGFILAEEWVGAHDLICAKSQNLPMSQIGDGNTGEGSDTFHLWNGGSEPLGNLSLAQ